MRLQSLVRVTNGALSLLIELCNSAFSTIQDGRHHSFAPSTSAVGRFVTKADDTIMLAVCPFPHKQTPTLAASSQRIKQRLNLSCMPTVHVSEPTEMPHRCNLALCCERAGILPLWLILNARLVLCCCSG